ncbi:hypothetical protein [Parasphingorhabdus sp. NYA22]
MSWQVEHALAYIAEHHQLSGELIEGELIQIGSQGQPDVLAVISAAREIDAPTAERYREKHPDMDFLCGYRTLCVWHGEAIEYLENAGIGWGSSGTLNSAALDGDANTASHKTYRFSDRLLRQLGVVREVVREFDRIHRVKLKSGTAVRIGMIADYEPNANAVRELWDRFGAVDIAWNINPNGNPSVEAVDAGKELGCEVMKWDELKGYLRAA